ASISPARLARNAATMYRRNAGCRYALANINNPSTPQTISSSCNVVSSHRARRILYICSVLRRRPRQLRARHTVDAILDAVVVLVRRGGLTAVTTNRVAETA